MSLSSPFIRRPVGTSLLTVAVTLAGALAYMTLPVSPLPQIDFPTISVSAQLPGASPETMASAVATPLERQFGRIAGITEMSSTSYLGADVDHDPVRSEPQHRRGGPRRAGGDQRGGRPVADEPAQQADLSQDQSGRQRDPDPGADVRLCGPSPKSTTRPTRSWPKRCRRSTAWDRSSWGAARRRPCASR